MTENSPRLLFSKVNLWILQFGEPRSLQLDSCKYKPKAISTKRKESTKNIPHWLIIFGNNKKNVRITQMLIFWGKILHDLNHILISNETLLVIEIVILCFLRDILTRFSKCIQVLNYFPIVLYLVDFHATKDYFWCTPVLWTTSQLCYLVKPVNSLIWNKMCS